MVYVFLATGFEEIEALTPVDLLRRVGVEVKLVKIQSAKDAADNMNVTGARGITVVCDITLDEVKADDAQLVILPGGMPGTINLLECKQLMDLVDTLNDQGKRIAAICAAPAKILGERGMLKGKKATCYPGMENLMKGAEFTTESVVTDGNITTSRGMGTAMEFGLEMVRLLCGEVVAKDLRDGVVA